MPDTSKPLIAVHVTGSYETNDFEYYHVGQKEVTAIEWGITSGLYCDMPTVVVFVNGQRHSEHPFAAVTGVYYGNPEDHRYEQSELEATNA